MVVTDAGDPGAIGPEVRRHGKEGRIEKALISGKAAAVGMAGIAG